MIRAITFDLDMTLIDFMRLKKEGLAYRIIERL